MRCKCVARCEKMIPVEIQRADGVVLDIRASPLTLNLATTTFLTICYNANLQTPPGQPRSHSSGRGGGGNLAAPIETETEARMAAISLEEREARDKVDAESARLGRTTGHGGLGNYQPPPIVEVDEEAGAGGRGRQSNELNGGGGGMIRKVMRSLSRQSGPRDRSAVRG
jgi:hypothetical protein